MRLVSTRAPLLDVPIRYPCPALFSKRLNTGRPLKSHGLCLAGAIALEISRLARVVLGMLSAPANSGKRCTSSLPVWKRIATRKTSDDLSVRHLLPYLSLQTQIGSGDAAASLLLKLRDTRILLDCGIDPGSTLSFAPSAPPAPPASAAVPQTRTLKEARAQRIRRANS